MARERFSVTLSTCQATRDGLKNNAADHPDLAKHLQRLVEMTERVELLVSRRNALEAEKQSVTRELQETLAKSRRLTSFLRAGIRDKYGNGSEKLVEFGMRPRRRRARARSQEETEG